MMFNKVRTKSYIQAGVGALVLLILLISALMAQFLRDREIESWRGHLSSLSLVLAEQAIQSMMSAQVVLDGIAVHVSEMDIHNEAELRSKTGTETMFGYLRSILVGLPYIDVATIVAANGDVVNFSRSFPAPAINLADRDYFKVRRDDATQSSFIGNAVRNKGNGKWVFYLSRRLNDSHGQFMGLVLVGISVDQFTDFYQRLGTSIGEGAVINLYRRDFTALTGWPMNDGLVGKQNLTGTTYQLVEKMKRTDGVIYLVGPRFRGSPESVGRYGAVRVLDRFPMIVSVSVDEDFILTNWRHAVRSIVFLAAGSAVALILASVFLVRVVRQRERSSELLSDLADQVPGLLFQLEQTPQGQLKIPYANEKFLSTYGIPAGQLPVDGNTLFRYVVADDRNRVRASILETQRTLQPWCEDYRMNLPNRGQIWCRGDATAQKLNDGTVLWHGYLSDITPSKDAEEEIRRLAFYDPLTGLPNRRLVLDRLKQTLASGTRSGRHGALLFIDLDNFKAINDSHGHDVGDLLLKQVTQYLEPCVREGDTVARLGGDEFIIILGDLSPQSVEAAAQADLVGQKVLNVLNRPYVIGGQEHHCSCSIGIVMFQGKDDAADELMKQADIAMYQAKKGGRNTLRFFDPQMQATINEHVSLESELRRAVQHHQLELHYQIQVDANSRLIGAEALIRWMHPERGLIAPAQFIPMAEENGLILPIGQWVLETACAQLKAWQQVATTRELTLSLNVSAKQFRRVDFVEQVRLAICQNGIDPTLLKLELTESMLLHNVEETIATMSALNELGVRFSLDDFGTGYSSLQYLKRLPLDQLKIDRSFVQDIETNLSDKSLVHTIILMAQSLDLNVFAEGVETDGQRQILLSYGCTGFQGYLFGSATPIAEFPTRLNRGSGQPKPQ